MSLITNQLHDSACVLSCVVPLPPPQDTPGQRWGLSCVTSPPPSPSLRPLDTTLVLILTPVSGEQLLRA